MAQAPRVLLIVKRIELIGTETRGGSIIEGAVPASGLHRNQCGYRQPGREPRRDREGSDETGQQGRVSSIGTSDPTVPALLVSAGPGQQTDRALEPHVGCMLWGGWELKGKFLINVRIPGQGDRDSEVIPISIPKLI